MQEVTQHRGTRTLCSALCLIVGLLTFSAPAQADPGTVTGHGGLTMTVDDTTPAPGQTITIGLSYIVPSSDDDNPQALGFGDPAFADNLSALSFVSCGGDLSSCAFSATGFTSATPAAPTGQTIAGTAVFTVSNAATNGETITLSAFREGTTTSISDRLTLTVTAPTADLGVSLSATAGGLASSQVAYDVAVHNNGPATATSATITTQLSPAVSVVGSATCTVNFTTDRVSCPIGSVAGGATTHATFTATYSLLSLGPLPATATRTASSPTDNNAANDSDSADCTALTALLITC